MDYQKGVNFKYAYLKLQEKVNEIQSKMPTGVRVNVAKVDLQQMNSQFMELQARGEGGVDRVAGGETVLRRRHHLRGALQREQVLADGLGQVDVGHFYIPFLG